MNWRLPALKGIIHDLIPTLLLAIIGCSENVLENREMVVQTVEFMTVETAEPDTIRTLRSLKREGDLYMITYYGDYNGRLEALNNRIIEYGISSVIPSGEYPHDCSIFSGSGNSEHPIFGRNLDNTMKRAVLAGLYTPPDGYASIAISNMVNMGFHPNDDPTLLPLEERQLLLNSVLFAADGINDRGVSVALASVDDAAVVRDETKKLVCINYLLREILDHAGSLDEAISIVENRDVFDKDVNTLSHHILIADASGHSATAEYVDGQWRILRNDKPWQIVTNTRLYNMSEEWVRSQCDRYRIADDYLENTDGTVTWQEGMDILRLMSVRDTQWSSIYDMVTGDVYLSLHRNYDLINHIDKGN